MKVDGPSCFGVAPGSALAVVLSVCGTAGCHVNDPVYFPGSMVLQVDGMGTAALPDPKNCDAPQQRGGCLRFRQPLPSEETERQTLSTQLGYEVPWLRDDRVHVEVRYTITNLGSSDGQFSLFIDGASEFTRFDFDAIAAVFATANQDAPPLGLIQVSNPPILRPGEVYQGVVREDDFHEAALDLHAMGRFMAPFASVLINRSEVNPVGLEMAPPNLVPPVAWIPPALWEITPRFNADQPMTCQFLVRVRDDDERLWEDGDSDFAPAPTPFMPAVMP